MQVRKSLLQESIFHLLKIMSEHSMYLKILTVIFLVKPKPTQLRMTELAYLLLETDYLYSVPSVDPSSHIQLI